ncbi:MAG: four helix bundle protein [Phycisphaerae bacterium]|nr:four helix bundle protein [Saprospiraceae bacterium]
MHTYAFEKLDVWQLGRELNKQVYRLSKNLPNDEKFGVIYQIRRASISVTCNLAEGSGRTKGKDQARFSEIAYGSLLEVLNLLITCVDLDYLAQSEVDIIRPLIENISRKISGLRSAQLKRHKEQKGGNVEG